MQLHSTEQINNPLTPPLTEPNNSQEHQHLLNGSMEVLSSNPMSFSSSGSSISIDSTSPEERAADQVFDKIEDLLCEFSREPSRHHLHCRVLRWSLDDDLSRIFTAVVVINAPVTSN
jgi:hypothetical protein